MEAAEERIMEFYEVDELSDSFRYPIDTKGKPTLKNNRLLQSIDYIDLQHIAKEMASLDAFLCNAEMLHLISQGNPNHLSQNATP